MGILQARTVGIALISDKRLGKQEIAGNRRGGIRIAVSG